MKSDLDQLMIDHQINALWVTGPLQHNADMTYFSGVHHVTAAELLKKPGQPPVLFLYSQMEREEAEKSGLETVILNKKYPLDTYLDRADGNLSKAFATRMRDVLHDWGLSKGHIFLSGKAQANQLISLLDDLRDLLPDVEFVGYYKDSVIDQARMTKETDAMERIRQMGEITTKVVAKTQSYLTSQKVVDGHLVTEGKRPITVRDVKNKIRLWLAEAGVENPKETIFAIGKDAGIPHSTGNPEDRIEVGKPMIFDIFPCEAGGGYFYDFTRTWCLEFAPEDVQEIYQQVLAVHHQIIDELEENVLFSKYQTRTCELFSTMGHPTVAESLDLEEGYVHSIGHGVGLDIHENPFSGITSGDKDVLSRGVVFTIEPGLYYPSREIGVRIEDTLHLNPDGHFEILAKYPYDLVLPLNGK